MIEHPIFGDEMEHVPEFAILQNSKTRETALWTKERGKWFPAGEDEYDILKGIAQLIRTSEYPEEVLKGLKFAAEEKNSEYREGPNKE